MPNYRDLSELRGVIDGVVGVAVGWLDVRQVYSTGPVDAPVFAALMQLLRDPWQPAATAGRHPCSLCRFTGGPGVVSYQDLSVSVGGSLLLIPTSDQLFISPSLIAHYIDAHGYQPPKEFIDAVVECPAMRSMPYLRALTQQGVRPK